MIGVNNLYLNTVIFRTGSFYQKNGKFIPWGLLFAPGGFDASKQGVEERNTYDPKICPRRKNTTWPDLCM